MASWVREREEDNCIFFSLLTSTVTFSLPALSACVYPFFRCVIQWSLQQAATACLMKGFRQVIHWRTRVIRNTETPESVDSLLLSQLNLSPDHQCAGRHSGRTASPLWKSTVLDKIGTNPQDPIWQPIIFNGVAHSASTPKRFLASRLLPHNAANRACAVVALPIMPL